MIHNASWYISNMTTQAYYTSKKKSTNEQETSLNNFFVNEEARQLYLYSEGTRRL